MNRLHKSFFRCLSAAFFLWGLSVVVCIPAGAQKVVIDPTKIGQDATEYATQATNFATEIANIEEQLNTLLNTDDLISQAYTVTNLLGGSPKLKTLISSVSDYRTLYTEIVSDISYYQSYGLISARQVANSLSIVSSGLKQILQDVSYITGHVIKEKGLSANDRLNIISELQKKCSAEIDKLLTIKREQVDKPVKREMGKVASYSANAMLSPVPSLGPVRERTVSTEEANDKAINDPLIRRIISEAEAVDADTSLSEVEGGGRGIYENAVNIASVLIGIVAALLMLFAFERRNRGEHQSNDAIYKVCAGLIFALVALQIVSRLFLF